MSIETSNNEQAGSSDNTSKQESLDARIQPPIGWENEKERQIARRAAFQLRLSELINSYCIENGSDTPDYLLAEYLTGCLLNYEVAVLKREAWYGRRTTPTTTQYVAPEPPPTKSEVLGQTEGGSK
jgi:hypothetical protein